MIVITALPPRAQSPSEDARYAARIASPRRVHDSSAWRRGSLGKLVELRSCDICQKLTLRRKLRIYCDMLLCRDCYQRYGYS